MRTIFLPNLKTIRVQNFSLYPNGLDFEYNFIDGVNLIMGGNGMGKTTFVNIIKYAIIGHYKKEYDFTRTYQDKKIQKRQSYPQDYYKNRQDKTVIIEDTPNVTIEFIINKDYYIVNRSLSDISLSSVIVNNTEIKGKIISQDRYDKLIPSNNSEYLFFNYEEEIKKSSGISFDDLIFFVNEILFFGENHKTILWNDENHNVQEELFNKYFNEPRFDVERQDAVRQGKYFDSLARHRSEDIRAIKKVLDEIEKPNQDTPENLIEQKIFLLRSEIEKLDQSIENKQDERKKVDDNIRLLNDDINKYSQEEAEIEKNKKLAENEKLGRKWMTLHKNYDLYFQSIKVNDLCPMCTQELENSFIQSKVNHATNCFLCSQEIIQFNSDELEEAFENLSKQLSENYNKITNAQRRINEDEQRAKVLDKEFRTLTSQKRELQSKLRKLEHDAQKTQSQPNQLQAFYDEIERLQELKEEFQEKSKVERDKAKDISEKIENYIQDNTNKFSLLFSEFAERFLGVKCSLTFTDSGDGNKRFFPVINGSVRYTEEELSESQRFFVDHSFRMSILSFFYQKPTFYIVETPNSSLDISYEKNAADVFIKFLENPNALIITTNLNKSEFLTHLLNSKAKVSAINLLKMGKISNIQSANESMKLISDEITSKINNER